MGIRLPRSNADDICAVGLPRSSGVVMPPRMESLVPLYCPTRGGVVMPSPTGLGLPRSSARVRVMSPPIVGLRCSSAGTQSARIGIGAASSRTGAVLPRLALLALLAACRTTSAPGADVDAPSPGSDAASAQLPTGDTFD